MRFFNRVIHAPACLPCPALQDLTTGRFFNRVIDDGKSSDNTRHQARHPVTGEPLLLPPEQIRRVVLCCGQMFYFLSRARRWVAVLLGCAAARCSTASAGRAGGWRCCWAACTRRAVLGCVAPRWPAAPARCAGGWGGVQGWAFVCMWWAACHLQGAQDQSPRPRPPGAGLTVPPATRPAGRAGSKTWSSSAWSRSRHSPTT